MLEDVRQLKVADGALRLRALTPDGRATSVRETRIDLEVRLEPQLRLKAILAVRIDRAIDDVLENWE